VDETGWRPTDELFIALFAVLKVSADDELHCILSGLSGRAALGPVFQCDIELCEYMNLYTVNESRIVL